MDGEGCLSTHKVESTDEGCRNATFEEAKQICLNAGGSGNYRLCLPEELNYCCDNECGQQFDDTSVWIETSSKGNISIPEIIGNRVYLSLHLL